MRLSSTQKRVFCLLLSNPKANDREIAEQLQIQRSTVTLARQALQEQKLYQTYIFPNFEKIPIALIGIIYGDYSKIHPIDYKKRMEMRPKELEIAEYVFSFSSEHKGFSMCFAQNLATIKAPFEAWTTLFKNFDPSTKIEQLYFPREMIKVYKFMDTCGAIQSLFGVEESYKAKKNKKMKSLKKKEKDVLLAWMQYPLLTNEELSEKISISRVSIGQIKNRLLDYDIVQMLHMPNWRELGMTLGVLTRFQYNPKNSSFLVELEKSPEIIFMIATSYEVIFFSICKDYNAYQTKIAPHLKKIRGDKILTREIEELFFPIEESQYLLNALPFLEREFRTQSKK